MHRIFLNLCRMLERLTSGTHEQNMLCTHPLRVNQFCPDGYKERGYILYPPQFVTIPFVVSYDYSTMYGAKTARTASKLS